MATIQSSLSRFQTSVPSGRVQPSLLITRVTPIRPPASRQPLPRPSDLLTLPNEPEDARLTGATRSLDRRLLALNLAGTLATHEGRKAAAVPRRDRSAPRSAA